MSLRLVELHPLYSKVSHEEAVAIANLGAVTYMETRDRLHEAWTAAQSEEESVRAAAYRQEGAETMKASLDSRLVEGEAAKARLTILQASMESEVARRVDDMIAVRRTEFELLKREEVHALEKQLAEIRGQAKMTRMLEEAHVSMKDIIRDLQEELEKYKAMSTKSSHALGKIGEATVYSMLSEYVLPRFPFSEIKETTAIKHAGDFHVWVMGSTGKRVKIMLDVKKYTRPVSSAEIEKLYRDIDGDSADAGMLISLDSQICGKLQFQSTMTTGGKPCMFLSFEGLDDGIRQEVLCWAVRVTAGIASENDRASKHVLMSEVQAFLSELNMSVSDIDACLKSSKGLYELLRDSKERLVARIAAFNREDSDDVISHVDDTTDMRCRASLANGSQCRSRRIPMENLCARHKTVQASGKTVNMVGGI